MADSSAGTSASYAHRLIASLGRPADVPAGHFRHPATAWADSGLMALTGRADGPPVMCPAPLAACADGAIAALQQLAPAGALARLRGAGLLSERARLTGLRRAGAISPGGACRLLTTADGALALNLARGSDWDLMPAWLETTAAADWAAVTGLVAGRRTEDLVARGRMMGLAVCADEPPRRNSAAWVSVSAEGPKRQPAAGHRPLVIDLSSLWAGPLCTRLLRLLGAEVVKIESAQRPDGARAGHAGLFARLNAGKRALSLDLHTRHGLDALRGLLTRADIVIEAARPRALRQMGIDAEALVRRRPGLTWVSITGYGRDGIQADWVAFGDDAGVAAGLSSILYAASGERLFCGDAIADPLTGLHAALAAWSAHGGGGGRLLSVPMVDVVGHCIRHDLPGSDAALRARQRSWTRMVASNKNAA